MDENRLVIPSDPNRIVEVDEFAERICRSLAFEQDDCDDIAISVTEAVNNAIEHGNSGDSTKSVTIVFKPLDDGLQIEVSDQGDGFEVDQIKDPTDPENLLAESGRGILIIRHLMDEVNVFPSQNGTMVSMKKNFKN